MATENSVGKRRDLTALFAVLVAVLVAAISTSATVIVALYITGGAKDQLQRIDDKQWQTLEVIRERLRAIESRLDMPHVPPIPHRAPQVENEKK